MATAKKREEHKTTGETSNKKQETSDKKEESQPEPVVISDTVTETTERIEVIEETEAPAESSTEAPSTASPDPLTDFKEKMSEEEVAPASSSPTQKNFMWPILFVVFLAIVFLIGIFIYKQGMNKGTQVNIVTLTPTPTVIPQPTKAVDLAQYEIKVLNGSEVDGEAGRQKANLEAEGFTVSSVGNAANSDYTKTIIQAKKEVDKSFLDKLKSVLELSFAVGDSEELPQDSDSDVIVIIGSETN